MQKSVKLVAALSLVACAGAAHAATVGWGVSTAPIFSEFDPANRIAKGLNPAGPDQARWFLFADVDGDAAGDGLKGDKALIGSKLGGFQIDADDAFIATGMTTTGFNISGNGLFENDADGLQPGQSVYLLVFGTNSDKLDPGVNVVYYAPRPQLVVPTNGKVSFNVGQLGMQLPSHITVPEPTSLALLGLGGLMVARRRRG